MKEHIIIYEDGSTLKVWTMDDSGDDFAEVLCEFYKKCGGKVTVDIFEKAVAYMNPVDACSLFNQLVNDVVVKKLYLGCVATELYGGNNG